MVQVRFPQRRQAAAVTSGRTVRVRFPQRRQAKAPQPYRLDNVDEPTRVQFLTTVATLLAYGPFRNRKGRTAVVVWRDGEKPTITGRAWVTGTAQYFLDPADPFPEGFLL